LRHELNVLSDVGEVSAAAVLFENVDGSVTIKYGCQYDQRRRKKRRKWKGEVWEERDKDIRKAVEDLLEPVSEKNGQL
jgi:hypothetical protein